MISIRRHQEIFDPSKYRGPITIIGAGATGSRVFAALAELGLTNITVYDFDKVEAHNLANQLFINHDIGQMKVSGLFDWYQRKMGVDLPPEEMKFIADKVTEDTQLKGVVFLLTDTMESRREIFERCIQGNTDIPTVIETRMAATHGNVFTFNPHEKGQAWLDTLIDDDDAETSACGSTLSVGTTASVIANLAVWQFMHLKTDPLAVDEVVNVFLKPFILTTEKLENSNGKAQSDTEEDCASQAA